MIHVLTLIFGPGELHLSTKTFKIKLQYVLIFDHLDKSMHLQKTNKYNENKFNSGKSFRSYLVAAQFRKRTSTTMVSINEQALAVWSIFA